MSSSNIVFDIPGYYFDPKSRRYFKQDPVKPRPQILTSTHAEDEFLGSAIKPQRSIINLLNNRENGFKNYSFENQAISLKSTNLHCVETKFGADRIPTCKDVGFLKGGKSLYVEYSDKQRINHFLEEKMHFFSPKSDCLISCCKWRYPRSFSTVDMVEAPYGGGYLFTILTDSNTWKIVRLPRSPNFRDNRPIFYSSLEPIWCCAKNDFTSQVVFGEKNSIYMNKVELEGSSFGYFLKVKGEVRSIAFNKRGSLLFGGLHTGHIASIDLRTDCDVFCDKLYKIGIDESILLSDENYLICGGFDGMICKVDLRMRKPVCEYFGHVKPLRKIHLSLCEANHLLCASGSDNVTRIWNLSSGGKPLKCIKPPCLGDSPCRSWLVSNGFKFNIYQFQKGDMYIYGNISAIVA